MRCPADLKLGKSSAVIRVDENVTDEAKKQMKIEGNGKLILRRVMARHIPESVTRSRKQGFSSPDASWFKGESIDFVRDTLFRKSAKLYDYLDFKTTTALVDDHLKGLENRRLLIWSLLSVNTFIELFT